MPQDISNSEPNDNVKKLAERIVQYETHDKGFMGKLFAFEARDGFWSKLTKTLAPIASASGSAILATTMLGVGPIGIAVAAGAGLVSAGITRAVEKRIFSDLHDSHQGNLGKFGHWFASGLPTMALGMGVNFFGSGLGEAAQAATSLVASSTVYPLLNVVTSGAIASSGFGDQKLRQESVEAKQLAQKSIESGKTVDQVLEQGRPTKDTPSYFNSVAPEQEYEKSNHFTKMIDNQRANNTAIQRG